MCEIKTLGDCKDRQYLKKNQMKILAPSIDKSHHQRAHDTVWVCKRATTTCKFLCHYKRHVLSVHSQHLRVFIVLLIFLPLSPSLSRYNSVTFSLMLFSIISNNICVQNNNCFRNKFKLTSQSDGRHV